MGFYLATPRCLADRFLLESKAFIDNFNRSRAQQYLSISPHELHV